MPCYAVLGATGNAGRSLIQILQASPDNTIHAFCRSKSKLENLLPGTILDPRIKVFEGNIQDVTTLGACLKETQAAFLAVAVPNNIPGTRIAQDTARAVIEALQTISQETPYSKIPKLIVLSSACVDEYLCRDMPRWLHSILFTAESNIYNDLIAAEKLLRSHEDWLTCVFVKPGALALAEQRGHRLSLGEVGNVLSYMDLAAGMVEVADSNSFDMKNVSVVSTGKALSFPLINVWYTVSGLIMHFFPYTHHWIG